MKAAEHRSDYQRLQDEIDRLRAVPLDRAIRASLEAAHPQLPIPATGGDLAALLRDERCAPRDAVLGTLIREFQKTRNRDGLLLLLAAMPRVADGLYQRRLRYRRSRTFGDGWKDEACADAMEALLRALTSFAPDPKRTNLKKVNDDAVNELKELGRPEKRFARARAEFRRLAEPLLEPTPEPGAQRAPRAGLFDSSPSHKKKEAASIDLEEVEGASKVLASAVHAGVITLEQQAVLIARHGHGQSRKGIALRLGINIRTLDKRLEVLRRRVVQFWADSGRLEPRTGPDGVRTFPQNVHIRVRGDRPQPRKKRTTK